MLLCSDGLTSMIGEDVITRILPPRPICATRPTR